MPKFPNINPPYVATLFQNPNDPTDWVSPKVTATGGLLAENPNKGAQVTNTLNTTTGGAAGNAIELTLTDNQLGASFYLTGTHGGYTIQFEVSPNNGAAWFSVGYINLGNSLPAQGSNISIAANGAVSVFVPAGGANRVRARLTALTSGAVSAIGVPHSVQPITAPSGLIADTEMHSAVTLADAMTNPSTGGAAAYSGLYNGSTWDRARGNSALIIESSAARTATYNMADQVNHNARGAAITLNVTAVSGTTPTLTPTLQFKGAEGSYYSVITFPTITATGFHILDVYPGIAAVANRALNAPLPRVWRLAYTIGGTTPSFTYTSAVNYIL